MSIYIDNKELIQKEGNSRILEIVSDYITLVPADKRGKTSKGMCPNCKKENGFLITPSLKKFGCGNCGNFGGAGDNLAITFLMKQGQRYHEALENIARILNLVLIDKQPVQLESKGKKAKNKKSYLDRFLAESGLTKKDVEAKVFHCDQNKTSLLSTVFKSGTWDRYGNYDPDGDDVIIEYFDIEGKPVQYEVPGTTKNRPSGKFKDYTRIRFQFPEEHAGKDGRAAKYKTPYGAPTNLYIPQWIRELYAKGEKIERLFIQEGEKKAEKSCKHGIASVGISGIQNLGYKGQMPPDLVKLIQKCEVKEIVLLFDADWNEISSDIKFNDDVQRRPKNFYHAAKNYRDYIRTLRNRDLYLEIYIGHIKDTKTKDKGIDDLLVNTLKGKEEELLLDINTLINEKDKTGEYIQLYEITNMSPLKLEELWHLNSPQAFASHHSEILQHLPEFKIGQHSWTLSETGEIISVQPIDDDEQFWIENTKEVNVGNGRTETKTTYEFGYVNSINFLQNRGFGRFLRLDNTYQLIRITHPIVKTVEPYEVSDFVSEFTKSFAKKGVLELLYRGGTQYLGPEKLSKLGFLAPTFEEPRRDTQLFYFKDKCWKITKDGYTEIDYSEIQHQIWADQCKHFSPQKIEKNLISVVKNEEGHFNYRLSKEGEECHMLQFLINTSNFTWRKEREGLQIEKEEYQENKEHLVAKLCAIGYMLMSCKDRNVSKAVVAMDGKQSEVGKSNGRTGKSIIGEMFKHLLPTIAINGKHKAIEEDNFIWDELTERTKVVFIDDVRTNFSLEFLFANITGDWTVNYKGNRRITFPFTQSPKIYITTNHALNGEGSSFNDRQWLIAFSDFYGDEHKPIDDFGVLFFDEWDFRQWNLLWNLMAECVKLYLEFGVVQAPGEKLASRKLRQSMGENFIMWAEEYFSDVQHMNMRIPRKNMYDDFFEKSAIKDRKYITPTSFKDKIKDFCLWKEYVFNPKCYDPLTRKPMKFDRKSGDPITDDKSGGVEYFTIGEWGQLLANTEEIETPQEQTDLFNQMDGRNNEGNYKI